MQCYNGILKEIGRKYPVSEDMWEPIEAEFEGCHYIIPKGWDHLLQMLYGNYMKLPNEDEIHVHGIVNQVSNE